MNCLNCGAVLKEGDVDSRIEWTWMYYHCPDCNKDFLRTVTRESQSELIVSDELEEVEIKTK